MFRFTPIVKTLVWGTETWLISSVPGFESIVADGPCAGQTINQIYGGQFPLLIKFIDANTDLSIQVHPDDTLAQARHGCKGKTEMWFVREADPGARLLSGLTREITPSEYEARVADNSIVDVLGRYEVRPGDVFFLPAGRIHAIGGGCHIAEIQQTSDVTYRIYDYGRLGLDGKPRELHTQLAKDAIDYSVSSDYRTSYLARPDAEVELVRCPYFVTSLFDLSGPLCCDLSGRGGWFVVICLSGQGSVNGEPVSAGDVLLLTESEMVASPVDGGVMKLLATFLP